MQTHVLGFLISQLSRARWDSSLLFKKSPCYRNCQNLTCTEPRGGSEAQPVSPSSRGSHPNPATSTWTHTTSLGWLPGPLHRLIWKLVSMKGLTRKGSLDLICWHSKEINDLFLRHVASCGFNSSFSHKH